MLNKISSESHGKPWYIRFFKSEQDSSVDLILHEGLSEVLHVGR